MFQVGIMVEPLATIEGRHATESAQTNQQVGEKLNIKGLLRKFEVGLHEIEIGFKQMWNSQIKMRTYLFISFLQHLKEQQKSLRTCKRMFGISFNLIWKVVIFSRVVRWPF